MEHIYSVGANVMVSTGSGKMKIFRIVKQVMIDKALLAKEKKSVPQDIQPAYIAEGHVWFFESDVLYKVEPNE